MARDKFISDNLINIRDHLRQTCAAIAQQSSEEQPVNPEIHLDLKNPVSIGNNGSSRSSEREYNEFAGRIQHDLSAVSAELHHAEIKQKELAAFNSKLLDIAQKLQEIPVQNSQDFFREFDRLKIAYFQYSGRASAYRNGQTVQVQQSPAPATKPAVKRDFLLPVSILISALLIALSIILVFA